MSNLAFLLVAVVLSLLGSLIIWFRHRKPTTFMSSIDEFQREMAALARDEQAADRRVRRRGQRLEPIVPASPDPDLVRRLREARQRSDHQPGEG